MPLTRTEALDRLAWMVASDQYPFLDSTALQQLVDDHEVLKARLLVNEVEGERNGASRRARAPLPPHLLHADDPRLHPHADRPRLRPATQGHILSGAIRCSLDGVLRQSADLTDMIWTLPEIIAHLSRFVTLHPGDLIFTGTPAGVGPIERGQTCVVEIDGLEPAIVTIS